MSQIILPLCCKPYPLPQSLFSAPAHVPLETYHTNITGSADHALRDKSHQQWPPASSCPRDSGTRHVAETCTLSCRMAVSALANVTNDHRLGGLHNIMYFSHFWTLEFQDQGAGKFGSW